MENMPTHVAFLRAINLGARRKFPQADIVRVVESTGARDVATYINTGNVVLASPLRSRAKVEAGLEAAFAADRGFEVPTVVFSPAEILSIVADAEELADEHTARHYVSLLKQEPPADAVAATCARESPGERLVVRGRAAHLLLAAPDSYHLARLDNAYVEKSLGVATSRNLTVLRAIAERWC